MEPAPEPPEQPTLSASLEQKQELYRQIQALHRQGLKYRTIATALGVAINTAMKYAHLPEPPGPQIRTSRKTAGFEQYLGKRWDEGTRSPKQLFLELQKLGYQGSYPTLARYVADLRGPGRSHRQAHEAPPAPTPKLAVSKAAFLLRKPAEQLKEDEQKLVQHLCQASAQVQSAYDLAQTFQKLVRTRQPEAFEAWLNEAEKSLAPSMRNFATGLRRDYQAVKMALTHAFSNGQVEGQVNRLKLIKRQMQGRAKLDLLRQRVMHTR